MSLVRVFISSPNDVRPERLIAEKIVARLDREFSSICQVIPVLWERQPLVATCHFQDIDNIPPPREADIVVVVLWARLGRFLPPDKFLGAMTKRQVTGTEWEFEDAYQAREKTDLMVYRKMAPCLSVPAGCDEEEWFHQKHLLADFFARWLENADGTAKGGYHKFDGPAEFEDMLYLHLREKVLKAIPRPPSTPLAQRLAVPWPAKFRARARPDLFRPLPGPLPVA